MRVLYDHQATSLQDAGGLTRYFFELGQALQRTGQVHPHFLLGVQNSVARFRDLETPARAFAIAGKLRPGYARYALNEAISALSAPWLGRYDVYHATYQRRLPYVRGRALVVTHHDSAPARYPKLFRNAAAIQARLDRLYASADRILCVSESARRDLLHFHAVEPEKTVVVHHGFAPLPADAPPAARYFEGRSFLLYVGARHAYKNFPVLLEALARQRDPSLCLLALGGGVFTAEEAGQIERLRLLRRVHCVPRATDAELAWAYRSAAIFVYPSLYEGFGLPPLEAMHAGCPTIVSRASALPEICGEAAFHFDPASSEELAALIDSLRGDEAFRLSKRAEGLARVGRYTWEKAALETLKVYREAIADRGRS